MRRGGVGLAFWGLIALGGVRAEAADVQNATPLQTASGLQGDSALAAPRDTSLAPAAPGAGWVPGLSSGLTPGGLVPGLVQGGVASTSFGSNGMHGSTVELDSGLIGGNTRASVIVSGGQGPRFHDLPRVTSNSVAVGIETALPYGTTLSLTTGFERDRLSRGSGYSGWP